MPSSGGDATEFMPPQPGKAGLDDWSSDGRFILYHDASTHMFVVELAGGHQTILVTDTVSGEQPDQGAFAPATNEVAFTTQETGRSEVYVKAFPPTGARRQISNAGGVQPLWRRDGRELYYLALDGTLMAVDILSAAPAFRAGVPRPLFKTRIVPAYQNVSVASCLWLTRRE